MKDAYDRSRIEQKPAPVQPTRTVNLPTPTPAPSPAGVSRPADRQTATIPAVDRAAQWAKTAEGKKAMERHGKPAPASPRKDWGKAASPAGQQLAPRKDWSASAKAPEKAPESLPRKDWSNATADKPREIKPLPQRDKSRDYDRDR